MKRGAYTFDSFIASFHTSGGHNHTRRPQLRKVFCSCITQPSISPSDDYHTPCYVTVLRKRRDVNRWRLSSHFLDEVEHRSHGDLGDEIGGIGTQLICTGMAEHICRTAQAVEVRAHIRIAYKVCLFTH